MSKRKGRKPARSSEIKSVLRAPPEGENELEAEAAEAESDTLPLDVLAEVIEPEGAVEGEPDESAAESEPAPPVESAPAPRARRLRAVRADDTESPDGMLGGAADGLGPDGEAGESVRADADGDGDAAETSDDAASDDAASDAEPFPPFPIDAEGDDTEGFLRGLIEALLFTSQKPLDLKDLARSAGIDKPRAKELIEQLMASYEGRGLCVEQVAGGFVMRSAPRYAPYIQKILALRPVRLSRAQLETLAIVAYRQPVTKPEVDDIRGVDSGQVIKGLLERSLLKMLGKKDEPGRPTLYGTTNDFLELLNLQSLKDLPTLREYTELSEESQRKFQEETGETPPSAALSFERPATEAAEGNGSDAEPEQPGAEAELRASEADPRAETAEGSDDASTSEESDEPSDRLDSAADDDETAAVSSGDEDDDEAPRAAPDDDDSGEEDDDSDDDDDDDDDEDEDDDDEDDDDEDDDDDDEDDDSDDDDDDDDDEDEDDDEDDEDDDDEDDDDDDEDDDEDEK
jgi:segregation and condensation protein B